MSGNLFNLPTEEESASDIKQEYGEDDLLEVVDNLKQEEPITDTFPNKLERKMINPWKVENIDHFLNYCCPECDMKQKTKSDFIIHALDAHPNSREFLPLFDFEDDKDETFEPLKHFSASNGSASVKLEPLSLNGLLKMECNEEDCGRFFVTQESMLEHKRQFHRKLKRKVRKPMKLELDYVTDIEPTDHLDVKIEEDKNELHGLNEDSDFEPQDVSIDTVPEEYKENVNVTKKRKLTDLDGEYGKPFCKKCGQQFPTQYAFNAHKKSVHSGEPKEVQKIGRPVKYIQDIDPADGIQKYKCDECDIFFQCTKSVLRHKRKHHSKDQEKQKCFLCAEVVPSKLLNFHMRKKHANANAMFECDLCSEQFKISKPEQFMFHMTKEHQIGEFRHMCDQCDKVVATKHELENHKKIHHTKSCSVICDKCGKECLTQSNLNKHLKMVHHMYNITKEDTIKRCDKCDIEFDKPEDFNDHLRHCLDDLKDFKCKLCDSHWVSHLSLWQHIAIDHQLIQHVCEVCGLISTTLEGLKKHKKHIHDKVYDFVCHICAQPKQNKRLLDRHMIIAHGQGERKFKCDKCDKSFAQKSTLNHHFESHHAKKTLYQCEQCPKTFWMKSYLKTHVRMMHENYRPHKCDICQQGFVYKRDVVSHKKQIHNIHE